MKPLAISLVALFFFFGPVNVEAGLVWLQQATSTREKTADALIHTGPCAITAVHVLTDGTNDATIKVYDATSDTGLETDRVYRTKVIGADNEGGRPWFYPIPCANGIYVDITDGTYTIEYLY